jgi:hypothetical protein
MEIDQAAEWRRLTEHYRTLYDEELIKLAAEPDELTEIAQQVLRDEIQRRGLRDQHQPPADVSDWNKPGLPPPSTWESMPSLIPYAKSDQEGNSATDYTWKTLLCECDEREQAWQIQEVLRRARIECWIEVPNSYSIDLSGPRVLVAADQLEQARTIIAQPIPQDVVDESMVKVPEYELPTCPHCGSADPILASVEPANTWLCEVCGKEWSESAEASGN